MLESDCARRLFIVPLHSTGTLHTGCKLTLPVEAFTAPICIHGLGFNFAPRFGVAERSRKCGMRMRPARLPGTLGAEAEYQNYRRGTMKRLALALLLALTTQLGCASQPASSPTAVPPTSAPSPTDAPPAEAARSTAIPPTSPPSPTAVTPTSTPTPAFIAPTPSHAVEVTKDLEYVKLLQPDAPAQTLDVYAPAGPGPWPVIVLNHDWYQTKDTLVYSSLAKELAGRGLLVFVPERRSELGTLFEGAEDDGLVFREVQESWDCAVRTARERAADYGGDPAKLTVFSHGTSGLQSALMGEELQPRWDEFASVRGGPARQTECLATGGTPNVDVFVGYSGDFDWYEELQDRDPELWELTSFHTLSDRHPSLRLHFVFGDLSSPSYIDAAVAFHQELLDGGYDADLTMLRDEGWQIAFRGPGREALIQIVLEEARR